MGSASGQEEAATLRAQLAAARKSQVQREQHDENIIRAKALEEHTARLEEEREALRCEYEGRIRELEEAFEARVVGGEGGPTESL